MPCLWFCFENALYHITTSALLGALFFNWQKTGRADWILEERARWSLYHIPLLHSWGRSFLIGKKQDALIEFSRSVLDGPCYQDHFCTLEGRSFLGLCSRTHCEFSRSVLDGPCSRTTSALLRRRCFFRIVQKTRTHWLNSRGACSMEPATT